MDEQLVPIPPNADGFVGRRCPACEGIFGLAPETNPQPRELVCPYCRRRNANDDFLTPGQRQLLEETAARSFQAELKHNPPFGEFKPNPIPDQGAAMCAAERTPTEIVCRQCSLRFAVAREVLACPRCEIPLTPST